MCQHFRQPPDLGTTVTQCLSGAIPVDTDWVIHYLNGHAEIVARLQEFGAQGVTLSLIALAELYGGVFYSHDPGKSEAVLQALLRSVELLELDDETTRIFGRQRGRLRAQGQGIGDFDLLIRATAVRHGLAVLTNNRRHFELIQDLQVISV
jgi:tRNA(fMet)-specific endonuclease VapC